MGDVKNGAIVSGNTGDGSYSSTQCLVGGERYFEDPKNEQLTSLADSFEAIGDAFEALNDQELVVGVFVDHVSAGRFNEANALAESLDRYSQENHLDLGDSYKEARAKLFEHEAEAAKKQKEAEETKRNNPKAILAEFDDFLDSRFAANGQRDSAKCQKLESGLDEIAHIAMAVLNEGAVSEDDSDTIKEVLRLISTNRFEGDAGEARIGVARFVLRGELLPNEIESILSAVAQYVAVRREQTRAAFADHVNIDDAVAYIGGNKEVADLEDNPIVRVYREYAEVYPDDAKLVIEVLGDLAKNRGEIKTADDVVALMNLYGSDKLAKLNRFLKRAWDVSPDDESDSAEFSALIFEMKRRVDFGGYSEGDCAELIEAAREYGKDLLIEMEDEDAGRQAVCNFLGAVDDASPNGVPTVKSVSDVYAAFLKMNVEMEKAGLQKGIRSLDRWEAVAGHVGIDLDLAGESRQAIADLRQVSKQIDAAQASGEFAEVAAVQEGMAEVVDSDVVKGAVKTTGYVQFGEDLGKETVILIGSAILTGFLGGTTAPAWVIRAGSYTNKAYGLVKGAAPFTASHKLVSAVAKDQPDLIWDRTKSAGENAKDWSEDFGKNAAMFATVGAGKFIAGDIAASFTKNIVAKWGGEFMGELGAFGLFGGGEAVVKGALDHNLNDKTLGDTIYSKEYWLQTLASLVALKAGFGALKLPGMAAKKISEGIGNLAKMQRDMMNAIFVVSNFGMVSEWKGAIGMPARLALAETKPASPVDLKRGSGWVDYDEFGGWFARGVDRCFWFLPTKQVLLNGKAIRPGGEPILLKNGDRLRAGGQSEYWTYSESARADGRDLGARADEGDRTQELPMDEFNDAGAWSVVGGRTVAMDDANFGAPSGSLAPTIKISGESSMFDWDGRTSLVFGKKGKGGLDVDLSHDTGADFASAVHARLKVEHSEYVLRDVGSDGKGSTNGTWARVQRDNGTWANWSEVDRQHGLKLTPGKTYQFQFGRNEKTGQHGPSYTVEIPNEPILGSRTSQSEYARGDEVSPAYYAEGAQEPIATNLTVTPPFGEPTVVESGKIITFGQRHDNTFWANDAWVSPTHARLVPGEGGNYRLVDLSVTATYVKPQGSRKWDLVRGEKNLKPGAYEVRLGAEGGPVYKIRVPELEPDRTQALEFSAAPWLLGLATFSGEQALQAAAMIDPITLTVAGAIALVGAGAWAIKGLRGRKAKAISGDRRPLALGYDGRIAPEESITREKAIEISTRAKNDLSDIEKLYEEGKISEGEKKIKELAAWARSNEAEIRIFLGSEIARQILEDRANAHPFVLPSVHEQTIINKINAALKGSGFEYDQIKKLYLAGLVIEALEQNHNYARDGGTVALDRLAPAFYVPEKIYAAASPESAPSGGVQASTSSDVTATSVYAEAKKLQAANPGLNLDVAEAIVKGAIGCSTTPENILRAIKLKHFKITAREITKEIAYQTIRGWRRRIHSDEIEAESEQADGLLARNEGLPLNTAFEIVRLAKRRGQEPDQMLNWVLEIMNKWLVRKQLNNERKYDVKNLTSEHVELAETMLSGVKEDVAIEIRAAANTLGCSQRLVVEGILKREYPELKYPNGRGDRITSNMVKDFLTENLPLTPIYSESELLQRYPGLSPEVATAVMDLANRKGINPVDVLGGDLNATSAKVRPYLVNEGSYFISYIHVRIRDIWAIELYEFSGLDVDVAHEILVIARSYNEAPSKLLPKIVSFTGRGFVGEWDNSGPKPRIVTSPVNPSAITMKDVKRYSKYREDKYVEEEVARAQASQGQQVKSEKPNGAGKSAPARSASDKGDEASQMAVNETAAEAIRKLAQRFQKPVEEVRSVLWDYQQMRNRGTTNVGALSGQLGMGEVEIVNVIWSTSKEVGAAIIGLANVLDKSPKKVLEDIAWHHAEYRENGTEGLVMEQKRYNAITVADVDAYAKYVRGPQAIADQEEGSRTDKIELDPKPAHEEVKTGPMSLDSALEATPESLAAQLIDLGYDPLQVQRWKNDGKIGEMLSFAIENNAVENGLIKPDLLPVLVGKYVRADRRAHEAKTTSLGLQHLKGTNGRRRDR